SAIAVVSLECKAGEFPSVGARHPPAIRLERTIHDLFGLRGTEAADTRPWLDHNVWGRRFPLGTQQPPGDTLAYPFVQNEGRGLHQIAVGPVHAGIIEPGHF